LIFRMQLADDFRKLMVQFKTPSVENMEGYKTRYVRKLLDCSANSLHSLRIAVKLRFKKVGGIIYYNSKDVKISLHEGY
jgi:hypothetical protein